MTTVLPMENHSSTKPCLSVKIARIPADHPTSVLSVLDFLPGDVSLQNVENLWCGHGRQMVGWGQAFRIETNDIRYAARRWDEVRSTANVTCVCSLTCCDEMPAAPVAFASFTFSQRNQGFLVVPEVSVIELPAQPDDGRNWGQCWGGFGEARGPRFVVTAAYEDEAPRDPFAVIDSLARVPWRERADVSDLPELTTLPGRMTQEEWTQQVAQVIELLRQGAAQKVVMSRDMVVAADRALDQRFIVDRLVQLYPTTWAYAVGGLVGATPEMLAAMRCGEVSSRVLAGTTAPGGGQELMRSIKDRTEHMLAVESVARALGPLTSTLTVPEAPMILDLPNVTHLATDVTGRLHEGNLLDVIAALHPTAAVCGTPTSLAYDLLERYEATQRGRYSGPVGWVDGAGEGEFGIALRCGQLSDDGREIRLFAGGGIMPNSQPEVELAETRAKMAPVLQALNLH